MLTVRVVSLTEQSLSKIFLQLSNSKLNVGSVYLRHVQGPGIVPVGSGSHNQGLLGLLNGTVTLLILLVTRVFFLL